MSKVTIKATREGNVITQNANKPEFGYFLVQGEAGAATFSENGFMNRQRARQCLVAAPWADLLIAAETGMVMGNGDAVVLEAGAELSGKIIIRESLNQADLYPKAENAEVGMKFRSGAHRKAGLAYSVDDQPIYQKKSFVTNLDAQDVLVTATNTADVNAFSTEQITLGNTNLLADFKPKAATNGVRKPAGVK